jgi:hypothetical protein
MPDDIETLLRRLIGGDDAAPGEIRRRARTDNSPVLLVAAALVTDQPDDLLARAADNAVTTRDRQLVAIATAHLDDDEDLLDVFVRDHLSDHPDNILAAWIAAKHASPPSLPAPGATMHDVDLDSTPPANTAREVRIRTAGRWLVTFIGFPLGGLSAELIAGPVDGVSAALLGGLITGAILGAVQAWGLGRNRPAVGQWIVATAIGLMVGLGIGAAAVDYSTDLAALVVQGAICGICVGAAQALVLRPQLGRPAFAWPLALAAIWAAGWAITTSIGVQVGDQFTVFGSSGAVVVTALTVVLPLAVNRSSARSARTAS